MSGYLTNDSLTPPKYYNLSHFPYSKIDQFLSTLHTLKKLNLATADFYLAYDNEHEKYNQLIADFIRVNFRGTQCRFYQFRLETFAQWQEAGELIPQEATTILLMNNLDHVFVPSDNKYFKEFIDFLESREEDAIGGIMHWQETITAIGTKRLKKLNTRDPIFYNKTYYTSGTTVVKPGFFKSWWVNDFTGGQRIVRPDNPFGPYVNFDWCNRYIPSREFFRHLDGYGHAGVSASQAQYLRPCCRLLHHGIHHTDWVVGFKENNFADLPAEKPKVLRFNVRKNRIDYATRDYLVGVNSHYFSFFRSLQLADPGSFFDYFRLLLILFSLLKMKDMRKSFYRNYFSITHYKYRLQHYVVVTYNEFQLRNPKFPKKVSGLKHVTIKQLFSLIRFK